MVNIFFSKLDVGVHNAIVNSNILMLGKLLLEQQEETDNNHGSETGCSVLIGIFSENVYQNVIKEIVFKVFCSIKSKVLCTLFLEPAGRHGCLHDKCNSKFVIFIFILFASDLHRNASVDLSQL